MQTTNPAEQRQHLRCGRSSTRRWRGDVARLAAALCIGGGASAAEPPPPPGDYGTVACVNLSANPGCPGYGGTAGAESYAQTPAGYGPIYADATARAGSLSVNANAATGALYLEANAGASASDYLYVDDPLAADSAWVPVRVTLMLSGAASYSKGPYDNLPFAGASFGVQTFGYPTPRVGLGTGRYENYYTPSVTFDAGLYNRSWMPLTIDIGSYAGIDRYALASSVYVNATGSIVIRPIGGKPLGVGDAGRLDDASATQLYSASGHDYTRPVPEPATWVLMVLGLAAVGWRKRCPRALAIRRSACAPAAA